MKTWAPRLKDLTDPKLDLSAEESFVFSRIEGTVTIAEVSRLTGLPAERVQTIVDQLTEQGALESTGELAEPAFTGVSDRSVEPSRGRGWRRVFAEDFRSLAVEERVQLAQTASPEVLYALCFDPSPEVAVSLFKNSHLQLRHARLIAEHHRSDVGLDQLAGHPAFLQDAQVQRYLFRNPQCSSQLLRRILPNKRLNELYLMCADREIADRVRSRARQEFADKFSLRATPAERVNLILQSDGRCLALLTGVPLEATTASLLCQRPLTSPQLLRNLARWASTTAPVLEHMWRQARSLGSTSLRNAILRHPNTPRQLKRQGW